ncbi:MAG: hypothetical protein WC796_03585 [Candidatus Pacearchaeota archaeon]|jgi:hypothetical protein
MVNYTTKNRRGVERASIEKVWNIINQEDLPLTPSKITLKSGLHFYSVQSCLDFLKYLKKIEIIYGERICLIKKISEGEK